MWWCVRSNSSPSFLANRFSFLIEISSFTSPCLDTSKKCFISCNKSNIWSRLTSAFRLLMKSCHKLERCSVSKIREKNSATKASTAFIIEIHQRRGRILKHLTQLSNWRIEYSMPMRSISPTMVRASRSQSMMIPSSVASTTSNSSFFPPKRFRLVTKTLSPSATRNFAWLFMGPLVYRGKNRTSYFSRFVVPFLLISPTHFFLNRSSKIWLSFTSLSRFFECSHCRPQYNRVSKLRWLGWAGVYLLKMMFRRVGSSPVGRSWSDAMAMEWLEPAMVSIKKLRCSSVLKKW